MSKQDAQSGHIKTAHRVFDILELAKENRGVTISEAASGLDISRSTARRYLTTLEDLECLARDDEQFYLGLSLLEYGTAARDRLEHLETIEAALEKLAEQTDETAWFGIEEHQKAIHLLSKEGSNAVQSRGLIGKPAPLHATAVGKAILAELPEARVDEIKLQEYTRATTTDRKSLDEELAEIRETGVAYNDMESVRGLRAVGCPVFVGREILGAISVSGPAERISNAYFGEELPATLRCTANELELNLSEPDYR